MFFLSFGNFHWVLDLRQARQLNRRNHQSVNNKEKKIFAVLPRLDPLFCNCSFSNLRHLNFAVQFSYMLYLGQDKL